ncbi:hypothetical protein [Niabella beijingensis]|uniref:hypothetical protein n=1 Tax=Niabella beijingensis TaxID=2872700 RepID=UPI001CC0E0EC|nr:hypothetical protein [Niabella beijingensis]MBZ4187608.1 hypothetical protein [Niabella beijingensis]
MINFPDHILRMTEEENVIDMSVGSVYEKDALEIKEMLRAALNDGNRFVSFELGKEGLTKNDFAVFKTAFEAHEHAYENSTDVDKYDVRSIGEVEKSMDSLLKNREIHLLQNMKKEIGQMLETIERMQHKNFLEDGKEIKSQNRQLSR